MALTWSSYGSVTVFLPRPVWPACSASPGLPIVLSRRCRAAAVPGTPFPWTASSGATPALLAAALAAGAIFALGLTLAASVRRRRRDLALLKTLGFTQRQLAAAVAWQASYTAVIGIVIGVPAGIILGRWLWTLFARQIYAVPQPTVPVLAVALVALGALALANIVAALP